MQQLLVARTQAFHPLDLERFEFLYGQRDRVLVGKKGQKPPNGSQGTINHPRREVMGVGKLLKGVSVPILEREQVLADNRGESFKIPAIPDRRVVLHPLVVKKIPVESVQPLLLVIGCTLLAKFLIPFCLTKSA